MTDLRKDAKDRACLIRAPGYCCGDPETTVLCHVRIATISGLGLKAPDLLAAFGCHRCHDVVDGRLHTHFTPEERRLMLLEGVVRTQAQWIERGIITW